VDAALMHRKKMDYCQHVVGVALMSVMSVKLVLQQLEQQVSLVRQVLLD
jgi:hypothetical protein